MILPKLQEVTVSFEYVKHVLKILAMKSGRELNTVGKTSDLLLNCRVCLWSCVDGVTGVTSWQ